MCGRYALALRPSQIRQMLRDDNMPVYEAPGDPSADEDGGQEGGYDGPRQSYNFAPGYRGIVYRADVPDWGAGPRSRRGARQPQTSPSSSSTGLDEEEHLSTTSHSEEEEDDGQTSADVIHYKLQAMKWGLIPFWTKRNPGYGSLMKTINCRDDSLAQSGGMWGSMKGRKRCVVVAQGFYEWLKKNGGREKIPHYVKRKDGKLMCFAGLWDVVQYENDEQRQYTYTIITTDSNKQLNFLHDRMPVILENGSEELRKWLDPKRYEWSEELQAFLKPYDGELDVYPVSKDVGKVGNNSSTFIVPVDSKENKSNIANFFVGKGGGGAMATSKGPGGSVEHVQSVKKEEEEGVKQQQPDVEFTQDKGFVGEDEVAVSGNSSSSSSRVKQEDEKDETQEQEEEQEHVSAGRIKRQAEDETQELQEHVSAGRVKREAEESTGREPRRKKPADGASLSFWGTKQNNSEPKDNTGESSPLSWKKGGGGGDANRRTKISATSNHNHNNNNNNNNTPKKKKQAGGSSKTGGGKSKTKETAANTQKITKFFANSS
ncbi:hypothetical protein F5Y17DRAFT_432740 [Xylariaceae sp. FL0594]|nr:hypothetical protein F5Y17DRAFT_432740 [Xylariaceae sp. FL0594]